MQIIWRMIANHPTFLRIGFRLSVTLNDGSQRTCICLQPKNTLIGIGKKLAGKPCEPFNSNQRIHIEKNTLFTYPDISIICGEVLTLNELSQDGKQVPVTKHSSRIVTFHFAT